MLTTSSWPRRVWTLRSPSREGPWVLFPLLIQGLEVLEGGDVILRAKNRSSGWGDTPYVHIILVALGLVYLIRIRKIHDSTCHSW